MVFGRHLHKQLQCIGLFQGFGPGGQADPPLKAPEVGSQSVTTETTKNAKIIEGIELWTAPAVSCLHIHDKVYDHGRCSLTNTSHHDYYNRVYGSKTHTFTQFVRHNASQRVSEHLSSRYPSHARN